MKYCTSRNRVSARRLKQLEESLGAPLFTRTTRRLILTDTGQTVLEYAEEIFALGRELLTAVPQERASGFFVCTSG